MATEQLSLLDLTAETETTPPRPRGDKHAAAARPTPRSAQRPSADPAQAASTRLTVGRHARADTATTDPDATHAAVVHHYPAALAFLREHGADAVAVLNVLAARAGLVGGCLLVQVSTRALAEQLGFCSKDSVHRRLRQLRRAGVLELVPAGGPTVAQTYVLHLEATGISRSATS